MIETQFQKHGLQSACGRHLQRLRPDVDNLDTLQDAGGACLALKRKCLDLCRCASHVLGCLWI